MYRFLSVYLNESYLGQGSLSLIDYMILESKSEINSSDFNWFEWYNSLIFPVFI